MHQVHGTESKSCWPDSLWLLSGQAIDGQPWPPTLAWQCFNACIVSAPCRSIFKATIYEALSKPAFGGLESITVPVIGRRQTFMKLMSGRSHRQWMDKPAPQLNDAPIGNLAHACHHRYSNIPSPPFSNFTHAFGGG